MRYSIFEDSDLYFAAEITCATETLPGLYEHDYLSVFGGLLVLRPEDFDSKKTGAYPKWHFTHDGYYEGFGSRRKKYTLHTDIGDGKARFWNGGDLQFLSTLDYDRPPAHFVLQDLQTD